MPSGLKAKLRAMNGAAAPAPAAQPSRGGLLCLRHRHDLPPELLELSGTSLRRIGWTQGAFDARRCLFLDTETTGLSRGAGTVAFLVGVGYVEGEAFTVEQLMMRDYPDEPELIDRLADLMDRFDCVCTFNGRTFDMPLLETRFTMNRMRHRWREMENLDLLPPARRTWKLRLRSCRLSRVEEQVLGLIRQDDLPGSEVPRRFFDYLKTGDMSLLEDILRHNEQDIATMPALLVKLCQAYEAPERLTHRMDQYSVGVALERQGEWKAAREVYRISAIPAPLGTLEQLRGERIPAMANWRIYHIERRSGRTEAMLKTLEDMLARGQMKPEVLVELSKFWEHRRHDCARALEHARQALGCARNEAQREEIDQRIRRLERKLTMEDEKHGTV